jgi:hypothetical protein
VEIEDVLEKREGWVHLVEKEDVLEKPEGWVHLVEKEDVLEKMENQRMAVHFLQIVLDNYTSGMS